MKCPACGKYFTESLRVPIVDDEDHQDIVGYWFSLKCDCGCKVGLHYNLVKSQTKFYYPSEKDFFIVRNTYSFRQRRKFKPRTTFRTSDKASWTYDNRVIKGIKFRKRHFELD
jgi:hypothetical protein